MSEIKVKKKNKKPPLHSSNTKSLSKLPTIKIKLNSPKKRSRSASPLKRIKEENKLTNIDLQLDRIRNLKMND
jgi:hypothetical protein